MMQSRRLAISALTSFVFLALACRMLSSAGTDCETLSEYAQEHAKVTLDYIQHIPKKATHGPGSEAIVVEKIAALLAEHPDAKSVAADALDAQGYSFGEYLHYQEELEKPTDSQNPARHAQIQTACADLVKSKGSSWFKTEGSPKILLGSNSRIRGFRFKTLDDFWDFYDSEEKPELLYKNLKMDALALSIPGADLYLHHGTSNLKNLHKFWAFTETAKIRDLEIDAPLADSGELNSTQHLFVPGIEALRNLERLHLSGVRLDGGATRDSFGDNIQSLKSLSLENVDIGPLALLEIRLPKIEQFSLDRIEGGIDAHALDYLLASPHLNDLLIKSMEFVSNEARADFTAHHPEVHLTGSGIIVDGAEIYRLELHRGLKETPQQTLDAFLASAKEGNAKPFRYRDTFGREYKAFYQKTTLTHEGRILEFNVINPDGAAQTIKIHLNELARFFDQGKGGITAENILVKTPEDVLLLNRISKLLQINNLDEIEREGLPRTPEIIRSKIEEWLKKGCPLSGR